MRSNSEAQSLAFYDSTGVLQSRQACPVRTSSCHRIPRGFILSQISAQLALLLEAHRESADYI